MPRRSYAGDRTGRPRTVATTSSRSPRPSSWRRSSARTTACADAPAGEGIVRRVGRFLRGTQPWGHVLESRAHAGPGRVATAHGIDQDVARLEVPGRVRMTRLPALEPGERVVLAGSAADLDERLRAVSSARRRRAIRTSRARGLHARRLAFLLGVVRWPRRVAEA